MTAEPDAIRYRKIRAPRQDGSALIDPPLAAGLAHLERAAALTRDGVSSSLCADGASQAAFLDLHGRTIADLSRSARQRVLDLATAYTSAYRDVSLPRDAAQRPLVLSGHQPTLFHPGVWFKNFVLSSLAEQAECTAVNLVVDNDTAGMAAIRVPTGSPKQPRIETVPFDASGDEVPLEERRLMDLELFESFAERVEQTLAPMLAGGAAGQYSPLVNQLWTEARAARARQGAGAKLGWLLAEARHRLEGHLGLRTLELPLSMLCDTDEFRWFAVFLLTELPRFREIYNDSLHEYRAVNHIRSRSHPVPDLAQEGEWIEAPFWIWSENQPRRRHLFVRHRDGTIDLSDRQSIESSLPVSRDAGGERAATTGIADLRAQGIKLRPRALVTTMFARLIVSDLFLHGIGGAKYDELTDAIIRRFFGIEPPPFLTVTATLQLPIARPQTSVADLRSHLRELRDLAYHPEGFASAAPPNVRDELQTLAERKRQLIADGWPGGEKSVWHHQLQECNRRMASLLSEKRTQLQSEQPQLVSQLQIAERLGSREFSFCLFPAETLPERLRALAAGGTLASG